jgi:hypothetical protein
VERRGQPTFCADGRLAEAVTAALHGGQLAEAFLLRETTARAAAGAEAGYTQAQRATAGRTLAHEIGGVWRAAVAALGPDTAAVLSGVRLSLSGPTAVRVDLPNAWTADPLVGAQLERSLSQRVGVELSIVMSGAEMLIVEREPVQDWGDTGWCGERDAGRRR